MNFLKKLWLLLSLRDKRNLLILLLSSIVVSFIETFALSAIAIFISLATNFDTINNNKFFGYFYKLSGCASPVNFIIIIGILLAAFYLVRGAIAVGHAYLMVRFAQGRYQDWTQLIFKNYLLFPYRQFVTEKLSRLSQLLFGAAGQPSLVIGGLLTIFSEMFTVCCVYIMLMWVNWKMTCVLTLLLTIKSFLLIKLFSQSLAHAGILSRKYGTDATKTVLDSFGNYKILKLMSTNRSIINRFVAATQGVARANVLNATLQVAPRFILETIGFFVLVGIILYIIYMYHSASSVLSIVSLYALAFYRLLPSANKILAGYNQIVFSKYAIHEIYDFMEIQKESLGNSLILFNKSIIMQKVYFEYSENKPVLLGIDLEIKKGERIAFVGESGVGKSTIADVIMGLYTPQSGTIYIDGVALNKDNIGSWRSMIGYVPQNIYLFDGTVAENVVFGREYDEFKLISSLKRAHIYDYLLTKDGWNTKVGDTGVLLSGGQKQRIALARAFYDNPKILVFDEATSALDNETECKIMDEVYGIDKGTTLIIIAHRLTSIERCEKIYKIEKGNLFYIDNVHVLRKTIELPNSVS